MKPRELILWIIVMYLRYQLVTMVTRNSIRGGCPVSESGNRYDFLIGILSPRDGENPLQKWVEHYVRDSSGGGSLTMKCFNSPNIINLKVEDGLKIPKDGWTHIEEGINDAVRMQAPTKVKKGLSVVIGPFYANLAMILEDMGIPYLVTDYKGFDWSDVSRVDDHIKWKTLVEVRPPMVEFNRAVVDLFLLKNLSSTVMIMPEHPKENQECQNLARQMIESGISPISYTLNLDNQTTIRSKVTDVLRKVELIRQKSIVICSPRDERYNLTDAVLMEAKLFHMLGDKEYTFILLDPTTNLGPLKEIQMYRSGLFGASCQMLAFRYKDVTEDDQASDMPTGSALGACDAARIVKEAKSGYLNKRAGQPRSDHFFKAEFLASLRRVQLWNGLTGNVKFSSTGSRINYTLSLYDHGGLNLYTKLAEWSTGSSTADKRLILEERNETEKEEVRGIFQDVEKVAVVLEDPFVMLRKTVNDEEFEGNERYEGFTIDLIDKLSKALQFNYEIVISPTYGAKVEDKKGVSRSKDEAWTGIVGEILAGNATLGMGAISITSTREEVIDFSLGILSTGVNILITKPKEQQNIFQFLQPFSLELWMGVIGASAGVSIIYLILDCRSKNRQFTIKSTLWFSVGTLLMKGSDFSPRATSQRILTTGFLFFVLITVSSYTANMAAFLTMENLEKPVETFDELADRDDITVLTVDDSNTMAFLSSSQNSVYERIWNKITARGGLIRDAKEGLHRVESENGKHAFIFDYLINNFYENTKCKTKAVSAPILLQEHGIAMKAGAPFKTKLNIELLKLKEDGFIQALRRKWWENTRGCDTDGSSKSSQQVEFDLKHTAGVFIVGVFGLALSVAFFLFKKFYWMAKRERKRKREEKRRNSASASGGSRSGNSSPDDKNREEKVKSPLIYGVLEPKYGMGDTGKLSLESKYGIGDTGKLSLESKYGMGDTGKQSTV